MTDEKYSYSETPNTSFLNSELKSSPLKKIIINKKVHKHLDLSKTLENDKSPEDSKILTSTLIDEKFQEKLQEKIIKKLRETRLKKYFKFFVIFCFAFIFYSIYGGNNDQKITELEAERSNLLERIHVLENKKVIPVKTFKDFASFSEGAKIDHNNTSSPLKYGVFYKRNSFPAEFVFFENSAPGNCFSFTKNGKLTINFRRKINLKKIGLLYPYNKEKSSAVKLFTLSTKIGDKIKQLGDFEYENNNFSQFFDVEDIDVDNITINVIENHGVKKYSTFYKIFVIGC